VQIKAMLEILYNIFFILVTIASFGFLLFMLVMLVYMGSSIFVWPPSMPTDYKTRKALIKLVNNYFSFDQNFKMADLGSGYGHLIKSFAQNFKNANITGFEILRPPFVTSKFLFRKNPNIQIIKQDFLQANISEFDLLITFYKNMKNDTRLIKKLQSECKPGAIILSNNFEMQGLQQIDFFDVKLFIGSRKIFVYKI
jgi:hypothetical protein